MKRIVVATGGTGGHIYPALALARALKAQGHEVMVAGAIQKVEEQLSKEGFIFTVINATGLNKRTPNGIFNFVCTMLGAVNQAKGVLKKFKPDVVIGFGGYGSFAVVWAAHRRGIPTMIHEQNVVPGKANRLLGKVVRRVAITFEKSSSYFPSGKTVWTGCPSNTSSPTVSRQEWLMSMGLNDQLPVVLITGGSQGSQALNAIVINAVELLAAKRQVQFVHMAGNTQSAQFMQWYYDRHLPAKAVSFISPIESAYAACDVVVARSGAATVCELAHFQKKAILIPYPYAGGHQAYNANVLKEAAGAHVLPQAKATSQGLADLIEQVLDGPLPQQENIRRYFPQQPVELLMQAVLNI